MPINTQSNDALKRLRIETISRQDAKMVVLQQHYMKTFPPRVSVSFGIFDEGKLVGVFVFGMSIATQAKAAKIFPDILPGEFTELQRVWISDKYGHNTESFCMSRVLTKLRSYGIRLVVTHSGSCKNDCGIVYQASGWLYFGRAPCNDYFLTDRGVYKSLVPDLRFRRIQLNGRSLEEAARAKYGFGHMVKSFRYLYAYPVDRKLRKHLEKTCQPFNKESDNFRYKQEWVK